MHGSLGHPRHRRSGAADAALAEAVAAVVACESLRGVRFWSAVVGRRLPTVVVSADAAKKRWAVLRARRAVMMPEGRDEWTAIEERVAAHEQARVVGARARIAVGYLGEAGIEPNVAYHVVDGRLTKKESNIG